MGAVHSCVTVIPDLGNEGEEILGRGNRTAPGLQDPGWVWMCGSGPRATSQAEGTGTEHSQAGEEWGNHTELSSSFRSARIRQMDGTDPQTLLDPFFQISNSLLLQHNADFH